MTTEELPRTDATNDARDLALERLRKRRGFHGHLLVYALFNACIVVVWFMTSPHGFFWPVFIIAFWGIGVVMNAWDVYRGEDFSEDQIRREMDKLAR